MAQKQYTIDKLVNVRRCKRVWVDKVWDFYTQHYDVQVPYSGLGEKLEISYDQLRYHDWCERVITQVGSYCKRLLERQNSLVVH